MKHRYGFSKKREPLSVTMRRNRATLLALSPSAEADAKLKVMFDKHELPPLPKKRVSRLDGVDIDAIHRKQPTLEADVLRAVSDLLAVHPKVCYALRINSGAASYETSSGKFAPVWFHKWVRSPASYRMPDFFGMLNDGRTLALECKRPGFKHPRDERELQQAAFLMLIRNIGGVAGFITDADQVNALLAK